MKILKCKPIMITDNVKIQNGGLTNAILQRANMLTSIESDTRIFTIGYHRNFDEIISEQYSRGVDRRVKILNIFEDFRNQQNILRKNKNKNKVNKITKLNEKDYKRYKDTNSNLEAYRYFLNGTYKMYKIFDESGRIAVIDYFEEGWRRVKQEQYNEYGELIKVREMDRIKNKPVLDKYFDKNGECYLTIKVDVDTGENLMCFLHSDNSIFFPNFNELVAYWINKKIECEEDISIICDKSKYIDIIKMLKGKGIKYYYVLHNNHLAFPYKLGADIDEENKELFCNINLFEKIVVLTEQQKRDILEQFDYENKFVVIPHFLKKINRKVYLKNNNLITTIARYEDVKRIEDAIKAIEIVKKYIPNIRYDIYGYGSLKVELQLLIEKLNLQDNVFLMGFTKNPLKVLQKSMCSILTSKSEGFGLVIIESLSVGTPVISYKINYGPEYIIKDGVNGFLIEEGNIDDLAKCIISLVNNKEKLKTLSENCVKNIEKFTYKKYKDNWINILKRN